MTSTARIALLQMTSGIDAAANAATIIDAVAEAAAGGAAVLFTPEMALLLDRGRARAAPSVEGDAVERAISACCAAAAESGIWLHIGSAPVADPAVAPRWRNRSLLIGPDGKVRATYDKIHMFDVALESGESWRESGGYAPGEAVVTADGTPLGRLGLSICYDLRFAALYDRLGAAGCSAIAIPAAFTVPTGSAHWHVLLRARAIEQGCFVIAAAQVGSHPDGRQTYGHSLVVNPWGEILLDAGDAPGLHYADINLATVASTRAQLPAIKHRRPIC
jgi:deaminated glutathione amidase